MIRKVVIPAAGLGTRMLPATKAQPKEMLPVVDRPVIQYVVEEARASGIEDILIITGRGKRTLEDHFDRSIELEHYLTAKNDFSNLAIAREIGEGLDTFYVRQKEAKGLGHAVLCARRHIGDEPFAVMLGDDIFVSKPPALAQMIAFYEKNPGIIIAIQEVEPEQVHLYGIVSAAEEAPGQSFAIKDMVEKPSIKEAPSRLAIVGRYIFPPEIFSALASTSADKAGEIQLTDAIRSLLGKVPVYGFKFEGNRYDVGNRLTYLTTNIELALMRDDLRDELRAFILKKAEKIRGED